MRHDVLVPADDLADLLARPGHAVRLLDVRWRLGGPPGRSEYVAGHVPGAVYVDLDTELADPAAPGLGRHPLPSPQRLQAAARRWGLRSGEQIVVYDDAAGMSAARAWWLLRWAGWARVRLLDGGLAAWRAAGLPLETGEPAVPPGDAVLAGGALPTLAADDIGGFLAGGGLLLDARAAERYRGEVEPVDPVAGHIPGAVSAPTTGNVDGQGRFLDAEALARRFAALGAGPDRSVAVYCGSGVTAAHELVALAVAGLPSAVLYPGSWSQWVSVPGRPVATG